MKDNNATPNATSNEINALLPFKLTIDGEVIIFLIDYETAIRFRNGEEVLKNNQKKAA